MNVSNSGSAGDRNKRADLTIIFFDARLNKQSNQQW